MKKVFVNGENLSISDVVEVACGDAMVECNKATRAKMAKCRKFVDSILDDDKPVYGINTGFGILSDVKIAHENLEELQINLIRSHAIGIGEPYDKKTVRAIMVLRANVLAKGYSGITLETFDKLLEIINKDVVPYIPCQGSVGASGDLAPLAHLALVLCGEGYVIDESGKQVDTEKVLREKGIKPVVLKAKEGLALINGTQAMTAVGALTIHRVKNLLKLADIAVTSSLEGIMGTDRAFDRKVNIVRAHPGQMEVSENVLKLIQGSEIRKSHITCSKVQDAYSLRCSPQVHGAVRDALRHAEKVIETEINSSTDNPLIFPDELETISAGNFHGEPVGLVMDYLTMAVAELGSISERRIEQLINPVFSSAPAFLVKNKGLNSGFMIAHVAAASLVSESKTQCFPATVDSIPTSAGKEDHVSMGTIAARKCAVVVENTVKVICMEIFTAMQAIDFRKPLKPGTGIKAVYNLIRRDVPFLEKDQFLHPLFMKVLENEYKIVEIAQKAVGELN
ncbi:MAG TPA: histidine ammonia-lyase [bacterium]|nr:histidine ammonia-lyase [bacterium]HPS30993.1 histidine ammonia-lyase [bacterium]